MLCIVDFRKCLNYRGIMKADLRISVKDYRRNKNLKVLAGPFGVRQYVVRMNGQAWPKAGRPVSLTRVFTALRKAVVRAG